jgi:hypothetical protein
MNACRSIWPPVLLNLSRSLIQDETLVLAFSPFIRSDALETFLDTFPIESGRVVVRWKLEDLLSGASDLGVFSLLESRRIGLYLHPEIHLKLFEFSSGIAYAGSSNITKKGLSLEEPYNEEMGLLFPLDINSYTNIRRLCDESRRVTKEIVDAYQRALDESQLNPPRMGNLVLPPKEEKEFLITDLPASDHPQAFLASASNYVQKQRICPRMLHDIGTFRLTEDDLSSKDLEEKLTRAFQSHAFVKRIVEKIRSKPYMNFGAVTEFVHNIAQDVPLPYRSKIKDAIARLYPWLSYYFEDLSWSVPGAHSQVIMSSLSRPRTGTVRRSTRRRKLRRK